MSTPQRFESRIARHRLAISDPERSLAFYQTMLGMSLVDVTTIKRDDDDERHYFLSFLEPDTVEQLDGRRRPTQLELVYRAARKFSRISIPDNYESGYWKIGITLPDVDLARARLLARGVDVSDPDQFLDVGYLCHLADPDGHKIELLQHTFAENYRAVELDSAFALGCRPTLAHITLRIGDPEASLNFYANKLGMRLLSQQVIEPYEFTLYFLAFTDEETPFPDFNSVMHREWLWRRPYAVLELQHRWQPRELIIGPVTGFEGLTITRRNSGALVARLPTDPTTTSLGIWADECSRVNCVDDPDGYVHRIVDIR